jgi:hypothetical protein
VLHHNLVKFHILLARGWKELLATVVENERVLLGWLIDRVLRRVKPLLDSLVVRIVGG